MSATPLAASTEPDLHVVDGDDPDVDVALPVYNEERQLAESVTRLRRFLDDSFPLTARITIVDNASTDGTWTAACRLADVVPGVEALRLGRKGRGRALRAAWSRSTAPVVAYMDVDLATDLHALFPLVAPLLSGHSDLAIGTRLAPGAHVVRSARRELLSRAYNLLLRLALGATWSDAQCGFKALRRDAALDLLPLVEDDEWFFDTELLVTAQRAGLRIHEVPVDWTDDLDSRVDVLRTAWRDLLGVGRLARSAARRRSVRRRSRLTRPLSSAKGEGRPRGGDPSVRPERDGSHPGWEPLSVPSAKGELFADELLRFAGVGILSTAAYLSLVVALESTLGIELANVVAIVACSLANTALHRRMTRRRGVATGVRRDVAVGGALMAVSLAGTSLALLVTRAAGATSLAPELLALTVANIAAAFVRFAILRTWVFRPRFA
ncbi:MAG: bifunctional glycosyltransferase family 2/GtrA family protein, partial [Acidimicrobiales bacterium]|nr:bifunctional glycosyltransferase family 2/GtrA family protein [Acidimicrobiales bacterium]